MTVDIQKMVTKGFSVSQRAANQKKADSKGER